MADDDEGLIGALRRAVTQRHISAEMEVEQMKTDAMVAQQIAHSDRNSLFYYVREKSMDEIVDFLGGPVLGKRKRASSKSTRSKGDGDAKADLEPKQLQKKTTVWDEQPIIKTDSNPRHRYLKLLLIGLLEPAGHGAGVDGVAARGQPM